MRVRDRRVERQQVQILGWKGRTGVRRPACRPQVELRDLGVRRWAAQELRVRRSRRLEIVEEPRRSGW
jgi:hypothetical protein